MHTSDDLTDKPGACRIIGGSDTPINASTLYRGIKKGRYPAPIKVGPGTSRWKVSELVAAVERAAAERELA